MKNISETNSCEAKPQIITLKGYYKNLPNSVHPKIDFIRKVALKCGVTEATVRNWLKYGMKPNNKQHIVILSEMTGIPQSQLWID